MMIVVDESDKRRGQETANSVWGNQGIGIGRGFLIYPCVPVNGQRRLIKIYQNSK